MENMLNVLKFMAKKVRFMRDSNMIIPDIKLFGLDRSI